LKNELLARGCFSEVEQSYVNRVLSSIIYELNKMKTQTTFRLALTELRRRGFKDLGIANRGADYFYLESDYQAYRKLVQESTMLGRAALRLRRGLGKLAKRQ
jgi:hypothetical protein